MLLFDNGVHATGAVTGFTLVVDLTLLHCMVLAVIYLGNHKTFISFDFVCIAYCLLSTMFAW